MALTNRSPLEVKDTKSELTSTPRAGFLGNTKSIMDNLICPISQDIMEDPVKIKCEHVFERKEIESWYTTKKDEKDPTDDDFRAECPECRALFHRADIAPSLSTRNALEVYKMAVKLEEERNSLKVQNERLLTLAGFLKSTDKSAQDHALIKSTISATFKRMTSQLLRKVFYLHKLRNVKENLKKLVPEYKENHKQFKAIAKKFQKDMAALTNPAAITKEISQSTHVADGKIIESKSLPLAERIRRRIAEFETGEASIQAKNNYRRSLQQVKNCYGDITLYGSRYDKMSKAFTKTLQELITLRECDIELQTKQAGQDEKRLVISSNLFGKKLIEQKQDSLDKSLCQAVAENDVQKARRLLEQKADPNIKSLTGAKDIQNPIFTAIKNNNLMMVQLLLEFKVDVNVLNWQTVEQTKANGFKITFKFGPLNINPLSYTMFLNKNSSTQFEIAKQLIASGADINQILGKGVAILHVMACLNDVPAIKFLIQHKADVEKTTTSGKNPLEHALSAGLGSLSEEARQLLTPQHDRQDFKP